MGSNDQNCFSSRAYFVPLTLILPSMICQQSSTLSLLSLFESQIFSAAYSHNAHLLLSVLMPYSLMYLPSMTSIRYLLNIFQQLMDTLTKLYEKPSVSNKVFLMKMLFNMNMSEDGSVAYHLN
jgi:hypothetical protein